MEEQRNKIMYKKIILIFLAAFSLSACGQLHKGHEHQKISGMEINKISNPIIRSAIEAWQQGNSQKWLSFFAAETKLLDDGNERDFKKFSTEAIGTERFTSIDKVEDDGRSVYEQFHSDTWGDFKTYFKFSIDKTGKIYQLEIGQAHY